jgi:hypothetical protein
MANEFDISDTSLEKRKTVLFLRSWKIARIYSTLSHEILFLNICVLRLFFPL